DAAPLFESGNAGGGASILADCPLSNSAGSLLIEVHLRSGYTGHFLKRFLDRDRTDRTGHVLYIQNDRFQVSSKYSPGDCNDADNQDKTVHIVSRIAGQTTVRRSGQAPVS